MRRNSRKGFTLIEVLLVVMILAMLAAFVVPNLMGSQQKANINLSKAAIGPNGPISNVLDQFRLDLGRHPTTDEGLAALVTQSTGLDEGAAQRWAGPYVKDPNGLNDPWGNPYGYKNPGEVNVNGYDLWSNGPDGQAGTEDDITNWPRDAR